MKKEKPPVSRWLETDDDGICLILKHFSRCLVLLFTIQVVALDKQKWSEVILKGQNLGFDSYGAMRKLTDVFPRHLITSQKRETHANSKNSSINEP